MILIAFATPNLRLPAVIFVKPKYVLAALRRRLPIPIFSKAPDPETMPSIVKFPVEAAVLPTVHKALVFVIFPVTLKSDSLFQYTLAPDRVIFPDHELAPFLVSKDPFGVITSLVILRVSPAIVKVPSRVRLAVDPRVVPAKFDPSAKLCLITV